MNTLCSESVDASDNGTGSTHLSNLSVLNGIKGSSGPVLTSRTRDLRSFRATFSRAHCKLRASISKSSVSCTGCADTWRCYLLRRTSISVSGGSLGEGKYSLLRFHCAWSMLRRLLGQCRTYMSRPMTSRSGSYWSRYSSLVVSRRSWIHRM